MDAVGTLCIIQVVIAIAVMLSASVFDCKTREVPDIHWWVLGIAGIAFMTYAAFDRGICWQYALMIFGMVLILFDILVDVNRPKAISVIYYAAMLALFAIPTVMSFGDPLVKRFAVIFVLFVFFYLLYALRVVRGGADTKCLIVMAMMFQTYPVIASFPLIDLPSIDAQLILSFPLALLFHAALFSMAVLFWIVIRKMYRRTDPVTMYTLSWYRMSIEEARRSHVWAKQDVRDGMVVNIGYIPDSGVYDRLESVGAKDVWVTPIIPFMVPLTAALIFIAVVGNILFIPFAL